MHCELIGITGGIGSGKSVVSRILRLNGEMVYDCDTEARRIMETDEAVIGQLRALLGEEAYTSDGHLNKPHVARIFTDATLRNAVNAIVHAAVRHDLNAKKHTLVGTSDSNVGTSDSNVGTCLWHVAESTEAKPIGTPARIYCESAILCTSGIADACDQIWLVTAPEHQRIERIKRRNGLPESEIAKRIASQNREFDALPPDKVIEIPNADNSLLLPLILNLLGNKK